MEQQKVYLFARWVRLMPHFMIRKIKLEIIVQNYISISGNSHSYDAIF